MLDFQQKLVKTESTLYIFTVLYLNICDYPSWILSAGGLGGLEWSVSAVHQCACIPLARSAEPVILAAACGVLADAA